ncbi:MAG: thioredoxin family protein [Ignavibacteria bacterium]|nr:thioredoxin family protein [Ignavibacteria bacterium]
MRRSTLNLFPLFLALISITVLPQNSGKPKITFIELGSVNCIPCKNMQPVMKSIESRYGNQIKIVFYDVWKSENKEIAARYHINLIPSQIFLDENSKEFFRHEGFLSEKEIDKILKQKGLKPKI